VRGWWIFPNWVQISAKANSALYNGTEVLGWVGTRLFCSIGLLIVSSGILQLTPNSSFFFSMTYAKKPPMTFFFWSLQRVSSLWYACETAFIHSV
jgi:hypothetical protein